MNITLEKEICKSIEKAFRKQLGESAHISIYIRCDRFTKFENMVCIEVDNGFGLEIGPILMSTEGLFDAAMKLFTNKVLKECENDSNNE